MGTEEYFPCMEINKKLILESWNTFVDIFLHRVLTCGVQARLLSIVTPNILWFCTSSMMLSFAVKGGGGGGGIRYYSLPFLSSGY